MEKSAAQDMKSLLMKNGMTSGPAGRVVEILEQTGYFEVPASMTFHGAWPGGLFEHSWTVVQELVHMTKTLGLTWQMRRSPVLVGMFHDLCKTEEYEKDGDGWKHYKLKGHGERSVSMAEAILNDAAALSLTEEEMLCIRWHMGFADDKENWNCYGAAIEKYQNVLWTHTADMVASRVLGVRQVEDARIEAQKDAQGWASVMAGNVYRHFKGGLYVVQGVAVHSETAELLVIYTSKDDPRKMWARPLEMFLSPVDKKKYPRARQKRRFEKVKGKQNE